GVEMEVARVRDRVRLDPAAGLVGLLEGEARVRAERIARLQHVPAEIDGADLARETRDRGRSRGCDADANRRERDHRDRDRPFVAPQTSHTGSFLDSMGTLPLRLTESLRG